MHPKGVSSVESGTWGVALCTLVESMDGKFRKNKYGSYKLVGLLPSLDLKDNVEYIVYAKEIDNEYGVSYEIDYSFTDYAIETDEQKKDFLSIFLTSKQVENLYLELENPFDCIVNEDREALLSVKGIGESTFDKIISKYENNKDFSQIFVELPNINFTQSLLNKLVDRYKNPETIVNTIKTNPYVLASEIDGIGWGKADALAMAMGYPTNGVFRISSFIEFFLRERAENGYSWVTPNDLHFNLVEAIGEVDSNGFSESMHYLYDKTTLVWDEERTFVALRYYYELEKRVSQELLRIMNGEKSEVEVSKTEEVLKEMELLQGWEYTVEQRRAVSLVIKNNVCIVTGFGGTGKTSSVSATLAVLDNLSVAQTALSGKASSRLQEVTGLEGSTIHKLLGYNPEKGFTYNAENPLPYDIVVLDECSMVGGEIFYDLIKSIRTGAKLVVLGDEGQLESIGSLNVFKDMLDSNIVQAITLTEIHRQAKKSAIIMDSVSIRHGKNIIGKGWCGEEVRGILQDLKLDIYNDKLFTSLRIMENYKEQYDKYKDPRDITVVVPTRFNGDASAFDINSEIQEFVNPKSNSKKEVSIYTLNGYDKVYFTIREGDRILVKRNNYDTKNEDGVPTFIFNGFLGTIVKISSKDIIVDFDIVGRVVVNKKYWSSILLGYAITGHSMQGSENKCIIVGMDFSGYTILSKEWIYTAMTRAKEFCCICAETKAFSYAISTSKVKYKQTFLKGFLNGKTYE